MDIDSAYEHVTHAIDEGRAANGYLVTGDVRGAALEFAYCALEHVFGVDHVRDRAHPDIHWLLPESKSRIISVESMRLKLVDPMSQTAFAGGWKAGVIVGADRLNPSSANAFLKTLEEPPPKTLFFLLTDTPEQILPTIVSRCQRLDLGRPGGRRLTETVHGRVLSVLSAAVLDGVTEKAAAAARLGGILTELQQKAEDEIAAETDLTDEGPGEETGKEQLKALVASRYMSYRTDFTLSVMSWFRDLAAVRTAGRDVPLANPDYRALLVERAARLTRVQVFRNVSAVERMAKSFERSMKEDAVLFALVDAVAFGTEAR